MVVGLRAGEVKKMLKGDFLWSTGKRASQFPNGFISIIFLEDRQDKVPSPRATKTPTVPHFRLVFSVLTKISPFKRYVQPPDHKEFSLSL